MSADLQESPVPLAEISQGPNAFEEFLDRNQKGLIALAILLALATAGYVVYHGIEKSRQQTAGEAFNKAADLAALQSVVTDHADTKAARSAMVLLAESQWTDGRQDDAIETLRSFVASDPNHPAHPVAQASLGAKLMAQGKNEDASRTFQDIIDQPQSRYIAPYALISLGDIAKVTGDLEKAEASYNRVKSEFSESPFVETASSRISALKAKPPVEVEAPPEPAPAPPVMPAPATPEADALPADATTPEIIDPSDSGEPPSDQNP